MKKLLLLTSSCLAAASNLHAIQHTDTEEKIKQMDRQYGDGWFEKIYLHCKAGNVTVDPNVHVDLTKANGGVGIDSTTSILKCTEILEVGDEYVKLRGKAGVDFMHTESSLNLNASGLEADAGAYVASAGIEGGLELGGIESSAGIQGNVGLGVSGGASIKSKKNKTCLDVSAGASLGIGTKVNFEFCLKNTWNPFSTDFWR